MCTRISVCQLSLQSVCVHVSVCVHAHVYVCVHVSVCVCAHVYERKKAKISRYAVPPAHLTDTK